jgi:hypothetical protein
MRSLFNWGGAYSSLLIAIQDFLVSGVRFQRICFLTLTPDTLKLIARLSPKK